jgi:hypothetical protein
MEAALARIQARAPEEPFADLPVDAPLSWLMDSTLPAAAMTAVMEDNALELDVADLSVVEPLPRGVAICHLDLAARREALVVYDEKKDAPRNIRPCGNGTRCVVQLVTWDELAHRVVCAQGREFRPPGAELWAGPDAAQHRPAHQPPAPCLLCLRAAAEASALLDHRVAADQDGPVVDVDPVPGMDPCDVPPGWVWSWASGFMQGLLLQWRTVVPTADGTRMAVSEPDFRRAPGPSKTLPPPPAGRPALPGRGSGACSPPASTPTTSPPPSPSW